MEGAATGGERVRWEAFCFFFSLFLLLLFRCLIFSASRCPGITRIIACTNENDSPKKYTNKSFTRKHGRKRIFLHGLIPIDSGVGVRVSVFFSFWYGFRTFFLFRCWCCCLLQPRRNRWFAIDLCIGMVVVVAGWSRSIALHQEPYSPYSSAMINDITHGKLVDWSSLCFFLFLPFLFLFFAHFFVIFWSKN